MILIGAHCACARLYGNMEKVFENELKMAMNAISNILKRQGLLKTYFSPGQ